MGKSKFWDKIKDAANERQVEDVYNEGIGHYFNAKIENPFQCDGFIDCKTEGGKTLRLIIEYKYNEKLGNQVSRAKVLAQVLFYLKKFEEHGAILPNVCLVGDLDECFVMHTNALQKYLDEDVDWSIAPSKAAEANPDLVQKISNDKAINPFVFDVNGDFSFKAVADKINDQANNVQRYVHITEHNLSKIFDYFCSNVLKDMSKLSAHDLVEIFLGIISDEKNYYQHPYDPNTLVYKEKHAKMDGGKFKSFFGHFDREYTPQETMRLKGIADRLIEDVQRRRNGEYWTPTLFVDYAHRMLDEVIGDDWRDTCVVWDNCWGTGNLTRDYRFAELYCSTLFQSELNIGADYNPEATKFQFDFLNDYIPMPGEIAPLQTKLPQALLEALQQDKPIVFFLNPPYGTANDMGAKGTHKAGIADTKINQQMKEEKFGKSANNLYAQFLYRILKLKKEYNLTSCYIGLYSPTLFLTGSDYKHFRKHFLREFSFKKACQFNAGHFNDVSTKWGISFSVWKNGETLDKENFDYNLIDVIDGEINVERNKVVYNIDKHKTARNWAKELIKIQKTCEMPYLTNAINVSEDGYGQMLIGAIGYTMFKGNNVNENPNGVSTVSSMYSNAHGISVLDCNFTRCSALFSARKLIEKTWINSKDEYLAPNENHPKYEEFVSDSMVHSLFHSSSNQSSLRQIEYKGKNWDIKNEFFWMSRAEIEQLANDNRLTQTYNDARTSKDRYVYTKLQGISLSPEAQAVLDKACEIVRNTFKYRSMFDSEHPEYQIMNWDCGWYQIKALAQEYAKPCYAEFVKLFKALEEKMRPMVYELGFLR